MSKTLTRLSGIILSLTLFLWLLPRPAQAYLDPGSGSYLIQILIASTISFGLAFQAFRDKISSFLRSLSKKAKQKSKDEKETNLD
jgi:hypothetical protein